MPVPETAVYEDHGAVFGQCEVWFAGEIATVEPEPVAHPMRHGTDGQLRLHVLGTDVRHAIRALPRGEVIRHFASPRT